MICARATPGSDARKIAGRRDELAWLRDRLGHEGRVAAVVGPPGVGKSALMRAFFHELRAEGRDSMIVDLASIHSDHAFCAMVGEALQIGELPADNVVDYMGRALAKRDSVVLLLDHAGRAPFVPQVVERWRELAPRATFLLGSRKWLDMSDSWRIELKPLDDEAALQLWCDCVRRTRHDYSVHAQLPEVREILRAVENVPLSIVLAAGRMSVLGESQLLERLERPLVVLSNATTSVQRCLDLSWDLLADWERAALSQCAVFHDTFDLSAVEHVLCLEEHEDAPSAIDAATRLRSVSLLQAEQSEHVPGRIRMRMLSSVRAYVLERSPFGEETWQRFAGYFASLAAPDVRTAYGEKTMLEDYENLRAVVRGGLDNDDREGLVRAVDVLAAVHPVLGRRCSARTVRALLDEVLASPFVETLPSSARSFVLLQRATAHLDAAQRDAAREDATQALALAEQAKDDVQRGRALAWLGLIERFWGSGTRALDLLERALVATRHTVDVGWAFSIIVHLGLQQAELGEVEVGMQTLRHGLAECRADARSWPFNEFGFLYALGHYERGALEKAVALAQHWRFDREEALCFNLFVTHALEAGDAPAAIEWARRGLQIHRRLENPIMSATSLGLLGVAQFANGDAASAKMSLQEAWVVLEPIDIPTRKGHLLVWSRLTGDEQAQGVFEAMLANPQDGTTDGHDGLRQHAAVLDEPDLGELRTACRFARTTRAALQIAGRARDALVVAADGTWFESGATRVDLARRKNLTRILAALAKERQHAPGRSIPAVALVSAGWPGEKMSRSARTARLHTSISTLRKLGLKGVLQHHGQGYRLDPATKTLVE